MLLEMADVMEQERAELTATRATVKAQTLRIEKLEHRVARLLRVQFGRSSEKMDIAQLRLMFEEVEVPEPANDEVAAPPVAKSARKSGGRVPLPAHFPRQTVDHQPSPCSVGLDGSQRHRDVPG
ncbi:transposase [Sphingobium sp. MK2]|uniref:transposase n=1 Tax=Sphingobium sp. MK2 TaxID=3116540 RepID=UPI0032E3585B